MGERNTDWVKFFKDCGIPSSLATKYAVTFSNHRIQMNMLRDLNKEILYDMGIKTMGDVIAILRHAKEVDEEAEKVQVLGKQLPPSSKPTQVTPTTAVVSRAVGVKRPLIDQKEETVNKKLAIAPTQPTTGSVEYMSRGSTYVIKMPNFATPAVAPPPQKASIFSRLGGTAAASTSNLNIQKAKITAPGSSASNSLSVFTRLGRNDLSVQSPASPPNIISRNKISSNQSILRGAEGSTMFSGKATATVKPTNLIVRKSINESHQVATFRQNVKNRIGVSNNQIVEKVNVMRSVNQLKTSPTTITAQQLKTVTQTRGQTISLKKSVFDRLGPVRT